MKKGAFTDAASAKPGLLEIANGGTVFFDELGEMSPRMQTRLLRALESREVVRVGGTRPRPFDARIIGATNRDLEAAVRAGTFRSDIFFRFGGFTFSVPPLRQRPEEVPWLAQKFLEDAHRGAQQAIDVRKRFSPAAINKLVAYAWPGNVRELRNVVQRAAVLTEGTTIAAEDIPLPGSFQMVNGKDSPMVTGRHRLTACGLRPMPRRLFKAGRVFLTWQRLAPPPSHRPGPRCQPKRGTSTRSPRRPHMPRERTPPAAGPPMRVILTARPRSAPGLTPTPAFVSGPGPALTPGPFSGAFATPGPAFGTPVGTPVGTPGTVFGTPGPLVGRSPSPGLTEPLSTPPVTGQPPAQAEPSTGVGRAVDPSGAGTRETSAMPNRHAIFPEIPEPPASLDADQRADRAHMLELLRDTLWNVSEASRRSTVSRRTFITRMKRYGIPGHPPSRSRG